MAGTKLENRLALEVLGRKKVVDDIRYPQASAEVVLGLTPEGRRLQDQQGPLIQLANAPRSIWELTK